MPKVPMPPTVPHIYDKNLESNRAALGRFIEEFELMIHEIREVCIELICGHVGSKERERLIEIAFHHQVMTAKPLYDIMRAIVAEIASNPNNAYFSTREQFKSLLGHIEKEVSHLYNKRNDILHGTWFFGYTSQDDPYGEEFSIRKFKTSADGLISAKELPKNAPELTKLAERCHDARDWIGLVEWCIQNAVPLYRHFKCENKIWLFRPVGHSEWTTLPQT